MRLEAGEKLSLAALRKERRAERVPRQLPQFRLAEEEGVSGNPILSDEIGVEHVGIIGIQHNRHAGIEELAYRMLLQREATSGSYVAGDAHLDRDLIIRQVAHQFTIFYCMKTVADPVGL